MDRELRADRRFREISRPMNKFLRTFTSLKLAVALLILIIIGSILGTLIPQGRSGEDYRSRYGRLAPALTALQLDRVYSSGWYLTLLALFGLNTVVCTTSRLPNKLKRARAPRVLSEPETLLALRRHGRIRSGSGPAQTRRAVEGVLRSHRYRIRSRTEGARSHLYARRNLIGLFGSDIVHLGLMVILLGGIFSGLGGSRVQLNMIEGEVRTIPGAGFDLRLERFTTEYYPDGSVRDWKSDLTVLEDGRAVLSRTIEVNHPLSYRGVVLYQSSYGRDWRRGEIELEIADAGESPFRKKIRMGIQEKARIPERDLTVSILGFSPDFVVDDKGRAATRSLEPRNPAALVELRRGESTLFSGWVFARFPEFAERSAGKKSPWSVNLTAADAGFSSGIQAARDPGVPFIWGGCALVMLGLAAAFYAPLREIRVVIEENRGGTEVTLGAPASRARILPAGEFDRIMEKLRTLS